MAAVISASPKAVTMATHAKVRGVSRWVPTHLVTFNNLDFVPTCFSASKKFLSLMSDFREFLPSVSLEHKCGHGVISSCHATSDPRMSGNHAINQTTRSNYSPFLCLSDTSRLHNDNLTVCDHNNLCRARGERRQAFSSFLIR